MLQFSITLTLCTQTYLDWDPLLEFFISWILMTWSNDVDKKLIINFSTLPTWLVLGVGGNCLHMLLFPFQFLELFLFLSPLSPQSSPYISTLKHPFAPTKETLISFVVPFLCLCLCLPLSKWSWLAKKQGKGSSYLGQQLRCMEEK